MAAGSGRRNGLTAGRAALLIAIAGYGQLLYPLWLAIRARRLPAVEPPEPTEWPGVSVVVPAYREVSVIASKVRDLQENAYPGLLEVIVVADDRKTAEEAERSHATVIGLDQRVGKAAAINLGVQRARYPVVVLTDANTRLLRGSIAALVRWFEDPTVGAVAGEKRVASRDGEEIYWRFESWLKRQEARMGTTVGLVGELAAVRRAVFRNLPADLVVEDLWLALDVIEGGRRVAYEPKAISTEPPSASWSREFERRTRVVAGLLDVLWRRRTFLLPTGSGVAGQLWGHRLIRSSFGPAAHLALLAISIGSLRRSRLGQLFVGAHLAAILAEVRRRRGMRLTRAERLAIQVLFLQLVGLGGTIRWLRRDLPARWPKPERTPPS